MGLLNRPTDNTTVNKSQDVRDKPIKIDDDTKIKYKDLPYKAKDRKPVQVDPPVLKMIQNISYAKDQPMYKVVEIAIHAYLNTLTEAEKSIYDTRKEK